MSLIVIYTNKKNILGISMPTNLIKSDAKRLNKTQSDLERKWDKAKELADKQIQSNPRAKQKYAYATAIYKRLREFISTNVRG